MPFLRWEGLRTRGGLSGVSPLLQWLFDSRIAVQAPDHSCTWHENVVWQLRVHQNYWPSRKLAFEELTMVGIAKLTSPCEFIGSENIKNHGTSYRDGCLKIQLGKRRGRTQVIYGE
jgi:hypothetical protein